MSVFASPEQKKKEKLLPSPFASEAFKEKLMDAKPQTPALKADAQIIKEVGAMREVFREGEKLEKKARENYERGVKLELERLEKINGKKKGKKGERKIVKKDSVWGKKFFEGGAQE